MESEEFPDFLAALRQRDPQAFERLIALCGPEIRAQIRSGLKGAQLRHVLDSVDVWQSILFKFHQCVQKGQFQAETFDQVRGYVRTMARNKLVDIIRKAQTARRHQALALSGQRAGTASEAADPGSSPSHQVAYAELEQRFLSQLSPKTRQILGWKAQGWTWPQIAAELGELHATIRIRFDREIQRALEHLGRQEI
jgi:RNA polymerase sigma factor (sigma-70 family)